MAEIHHDEPELLDELAPTGADEDDEYECFDVQVWAEAYLADAEAQAEHAQFPGVPF